MIDEVVAAERARFEAVSARVVRAMADDARIRFAVDRQRRIVVMCEGRHRTGWALVLARAGDFVEPVLMDSTAPPRTVFVRDRDLARAFQCAECGRWFQRSRVSLLELAVEALVAGFRDGKTPATRRIS